MERAKKIIIIVLLIIILIVADQIAKSIVPRDGMEIISGALKLTYTENTGGAFGIANDNIMVIIITNIIVIGIVIRFLILQFDKTDKATTITLCLIIAGGLSNFLDRIIRGYVIDYIDINEIFPYPIFNLADIFIVIGWICLVVLTIRATIKGVKKK